MYIYIYIYIYIYKIYQICPDIVYIPCLVSPSLESSDFFNDPFANDIRPHAAQFILRTLHMQRILSTDAAHDAAQRILIYFHTHCEFYPTDAAHAKKKQCNTPTPISSLTNHIFADTI